MITLTLYECEHEGDLEHYEADINKCGGKIVESSINEDAECATVRIEADDINAFLTAFRQTETCDFSNLAN